MDPAKRHRLIIGTLSLYIMFVFVQSLFFKFTDSPETQHIFGTLDRWATGLGCAGLFAPNGIFSQYVVGGAELVASALLLSGLISGSGLLRLAGAGLSVAVISGAIFFHLFTPLGVQVINTDGSLDGGQLFMLACGVWLAGMALIWLHRSALCALLSRFGVWQVR